MSYQKSNAYTKSKQLDFKGVIFRCLDRLTNLIMGESSESGKFLGDLYERFEFGVSILDTYLFPFRDEYFKEKAKPREQLIEIMLLLNRQNLLLESEVNENLEDLITDAELDKINTLEEDDELEAELEVIDNEAEKKEANSN